MQAYLDPDAPTHIVSLRFVEGSLGWLARCCVPVTLFSVGMWAHNHQQVAAGPGSGAWRQVRVAEGRRVWDRCVGRAVLGTRGHCGRLDLYGRPAHLITANRSQSAARLAARVSV